ncbi:MAG TPA: HhH-GPD-type base excision DNA repair protein [Candidatus Eisenbacteria bacterium]|nr:HhH-GPD-type base excision DNA repair protein [Candidatus Eisenbacteria bacterium]
MPGRPGGLHLTGDPEADGLLDRDPFALLAGMLLDQQMPMERAFAGPYRLAERLGQPDRLDPRVVAGYDPAEFAALCAQPPAVHRYPGSMAGRLQALARAVVEDYAGDTAAVWADAGTGAELLARLRALPGFGDAKARIFLALLGKQRGVQPPGWREAAGLYGEEGSHRSVADVVDEASLVKVRDTKKQLKAAAKGRR